MLDIRANIILQGDCLEVLKTIPDHSVDSIVTDPPYGLGQKNPTGEEIEAYLNGSDLDTKGDFMSYDWSIPPVAVWKECLRILKPGGYLLSFAGSRTWDIMSVGIRAAGFENRDTVASMFGPMSTLQWIYGSGFPKSMNIGKMLDKQGLRCKCEDAPSERVEGKPWPMCLTCSKPVVPEGLGTALKPAWEPILCFRSPIGDSTVSSQVLTSGTGSLDIDSTRVKHANAADLENHKSMVEAIKTRGGSMANSWKNSSDLSGASDVQEGGRWPANVVTTHSDACVQVGTQKVDAPVINRFTDGMKPFGNGAGHGYTSTSTGDANGKEEVPTYECAEGCPVKAIETKEDMASRYFVQFVPDAPFYYGAKASRSERNEGFPAREKKSAKDKRKVVTYILKEDLDTDLMVEVTEVVKDNMAILFKDIIFDEEMTIEDSVFEADHFEVLVPEQYREHFEVSEWVGNSHPTVKPVALMRYLVKMVTPPGSITVDPYCGSGTTCLAATLEGRQFIGIERDPKFYAIAHTRVMKPFVEQEGKRLGGELIKDSIGVDV